MVKDNKSLYWFYTGLAIFLLMGIGIGIASFKLDYVADSIYGVIDWFAALIPYFFYFALAGLIVDFFIAKKRKQKFIFPLWEKYTLSFIVLSIIACAFWVGNFSAKGILFYISFPFYYAIFFSGYAYVLLSHNLFNTSYSIKLFLDLCFLTLVVVWARLEIKNKDKNQQINLRKFLITLIFVILTAGMINLVRNLS